MTQRLVSVGDDLTVPAALKITDANLPAASKAAALNATFGPLRNTIQPTVWHVILGFGQSNMDGRGTPYGPTTDPIDNRVFMFAYSGTYKNMIMPAGDPLPGQGGYPSGLGPLSGFGRILASKLPENHKVLLVPAAIGGTAFESGTNRWKTATTPDANNLWLQAMNHMGRVTAALTALGDTYYIDAALWLQGETDGDNNVSGATYQADLDALIDATRTSLALPNLPFIVGQMVPDYLDTGTRNAINAVHAGTPARKTKTAFAQGLPGQAQNNDQNHYNAVAARFMSQSMFNAYLRVVNGTAEPALPSAPGQTVGMGSSNVTSTTLKVTWTATAGATVYRVYWKATASGTWLHYNSTTATSQDFTGLTGSTSYDFKVVPINAAGVGTTSATYTVSTSAVALTAGVPLAALAAYSVSRQMVNTWTGALIRVRRPSDNAELDIGMVAGALDTAALASHSGGTEDLFVTTIYDQTGLGKHVTQATAASQPKIMNAGVLITAGGKPAVTFDGTDDYLFRTSSNGIFAAGSATVVGVVKAPAVTAAKRLWTESIAAQSADQYGLMTPDYGSSLGGRAWPLMSGVVTSTSGNAGSIDVWNNTIRQFSATDTGTQFNQWVDAAADLTALAYTRAGNAKDRFAIGAVVRSGSLANFGFTFSEMAFWGSALGTTDRQTAEANQKAFYGTP